MIVDTSALMAIALGEPDAEHFIRIMYDADQLSIAAPTLLEALMVAEGKRDGGAAVVEEIMAELEIDVLHSGEGETRAAYEAWHRFGRGRHSAKLNFGDCMSYAAARISGRPLLAKGDDFPQTDIALVV